MPPTYTIQSAGFPTLEEEFADEVKPESARPRISQGHYPVWDMFMDEFQMMDMTEQIMTGKPYPIRGVFALGLNDRMFPESGKTREALKIQGLSRRFLHVYKACDTADLQFKK